MPNPKDITDPTTAMNMALALMAKAFKLNYSTPTNNNQRISSNPRNRQIAQSGNLNGYNVVQNVRNQVAQNAIQNLRIQNVGNQNGQIVVPRTNQNLNGNGNLVAARAEGNAIGHNGNQIRCYNCRGVDLDENEEVNANCILMANLQQASTSGTQTNKAPVYDSDGSAENDNNVIFEVTSIEQSGRTIEKHPSNVEETRALYDSLYYNLAIEVEKVNTVNRKLKQTNAELTTELARFKNQEKCFEISQEKYDKLERYELLDKEIQLEKKIKELDNILVKTAKFVGDFKSLAKEADESFAKHKTLELEIERLLRAVISQDIMSVVQNNSVGETSNLQTKLERTKEGKPRGTSMNTKFAKQSLLGKPATLGGTQALSKPATSNSIPTPQESKVVKNDKVISPGMFRINPFKTSREEKHVPNTVKASTRTKPITVSQLSIFTKKDVNSESNGNLNLFINFVWKFLGTVRFGNDHVAAILGFGDLHWGNILITRVYFVEGLGHNLFSIGQFCDSDLEVAFRRNACFVRNLEGVDFISGNQATNLYTINLHDMASTSLICLMARASSTKSWLWHQRLSHLNFDTINDLAKHDLVSGLPKFKYHKEHLCFSCKQGKSKRASYPPKPIPNSRQSLKPELQSITSGQISSRLDLTYAPSTITTQQPTEGELDLLFKAMYDDYIGGQPSTAQRTDSATQAHQVRQTSTTSTSIADIAPTPTNSSSQATNFPRTSQDVDGLKSQQQQAQQQGNQASL
nr:retrovirus-related Pol polyprotein from transposon TNT 1-94 [Tanacetum cinerariifolium]